MNIEPTENREVKSEPSSVSSPEFKASALAELKGWAKKGHCKLAAGNEVQWTAEELAAMTPEERERCAGKRS